MIVCLPACLSLFANITEQVALIVSSWWLHKLVPLPTDDDDDDEVRRATRNRSKMTPTHTMAAAAATAGEDWEKERERGKRGKIQMNQTRNFECVCEGRGTCTSQHGKNNENLKDTHTHTPSHQPPAADAIRYVLAMILQASQTNTKQIFLSATLIFLLPKNCVLFHFLKNVDLYIKIYIKIK